MSYRLVKTCDACPEQYDVFEGDEQVGYLRLRHGGFRADYPGCGGETVYSASPEGDGIFEDHEREYYLSRALEAIRLAHEGEPAPEQVASILELRETFRSEGLAAFHGNEYATAVLRYGDHDDECNTNQAWGTGPNECDCGFARFTGELQASDEIRDSYEKVRKHDRRHSSFGR